MYSALRKWDEQIKLHVTDGVNMAMKHLKPGDVVLDIGANTGMFCRELQKRQKTECYLFEPVRDYYEYMVYKFRDRPHLKAFNYGLVAEGGPAKKKIFIGQKNLGWNTFIEEKVDDDNKHIYMNVAVASLDWLQENQLHIPRIDFVKIDVEGYEAEVLIGMMGIIKKFMPILLVEFAWGKKHPNLAKTEKVLQILYNIGYKKVNPIAEGTCDRILVPESRPSDTSIKGKVLVVADCDWWAFGKIYRGIKKYATRWDVDVHYTDKSHVIPHRKYDVVLFLPDHIPTLIADNGIPREKLIWAIRYGANINHPIYSNSYALINAAKIIAASNQKIVERFKKIHPKVMYAPGGVDTDIFSYCEYQMSNPVRVGWAGNLGKGIGYRGIEIIKGACKNLGFKFNPAISDYRRRNEKEMVQYYHNDIDIYVEMSEDAGRQNGLVEAGSCGLPIISSDVGIASQLIKNGENGFISERTVDALTERLKAILPITGKVGKQIRADIEAQWSWKAQVKLFEKMFDAIMGRT